MSPADKGLDRSRLVELRWARTDLKARLLECRDNRAAAALHLRYADVLEQIETIEAAIPKQPQTALDELADRRRAAGLPDASQTTRAARR